MYSLCQVSGNKPEQTLRNWVARRTRSRQQELFLRSWVWVAEQEPKKLKMAGSLPQLSPKLVRLPHSISIVDELVSSGSFHTEARAKGTHTMFTTRPF